MLVPSGADLDKEGLSVICIATTFGEAGHLDDPNGVIKGDRHDVISLDRVAGGANTLAIDPDVASLN